MGLADTHRIIQDASLPLFPYDVMPKLKNKPRAINPYKTQLLSVTPYTCR
ncbi:MAG: hypothetical protein ACI9IQ_002965, partial [Cyclobacteriaceae bacterium]